MGYSDVVLSDSPISYWKLDETSGTSAVDSGSAANNGTYINTPTLNQTPLISTGKSVRLTKAQAERIRVPYAAAYNTAAYRATATFEMWVEFFSFPVAGNQDGLIYREGAPPSEADVHFQVQNNAGTTTAQIHFGDGTTQFNASHTTALTTGVKYHIVGRFNAGATAIFVNNVKVTGGTGGATMASSTSDFDIGALEYPLNSGTLIRHADMKIDEVAIYNTALSDARIAAHYSAGFPVPVFTGGTITEDYNYRYHKFTTSGTLSKTSTGNAAVDVLVVAGGGSGGATTLNPSGGGGAGGLSWNEVFIISATDTTVTVGAGGTAANGANSVFGSLTATGGGKGGDGSGTGSAGGSGGGGGGSLTTSMAGGAGTSDQGFAGASGFFAADETRAGGGGGGATAVGTGTVSSQAGGAGSDKSAIFGTGVGVSGVFAKGGDGKAYAGTAGSAGAANTGNGGQGGGFNTSGGNGGSGFVMLRFAIVSTTETVTTAAPITTATFAPAIELSYTISPTAGTMTLEGHSPALGNDAVQEPTAGTITAQGYGPTFLLSITTTPSSGSFSFAGLDPVVTNAVTVLVSPNVASVAATGLNPDIGTGATISVDAPTTVTFAGLTATQFPADPQKIAPNADLATSGWSRSGASIQPTYWQSVAVTNIEGHYVFTGASASLRLAFDSPAQFPGPGSKTLRYRLRNDASFTNGTITVELRDGATVIGTWNHGTTNYPYPGTVFDQDWSFYGITNYSNLEIWVTSSIVGSADVIYLYFTELEVPSFYGAADVVQNVDQAPNIVFTGLDAEAGTLQIVDAPVAALTITTYEPLIIPRTPMLYLRPIMDLGGGDGFPEWDTTSSPRWATIDDTDAVFPGDAEYQYVNYPGGFAPGLPYERVSRFKFAPTPTPVGMTSMTWHVNQSLSSGTGMVCDHVLLNGDDLSAITGPLRSRLVGDKYTISYTLDANLISKVHDWSNIVLDTYAYPSGLGPAPEHVRVNWTRLDVPNTEGSTQVTVGAPTNFLYFTWAPIITSEKQIPDPAEFLLTGWDADVTPSLPLATRSVIGTSTTPFLRVLNLGTKLIDTGWPALVATALDIASNTNHVVAGTTGGTRLQVIDSATKAFIIGYPTLQRDANAVAISPDGAAVAIGTRKWTDSNSTIGGTFPSFNVVNLTTKGLEAGWPSINSMITDVAWNSTGTKIALACVEAPFVRVINVATKAVETGWTDVENSATAVVWLNERLLVAHRGGKRFTVYDGAKAKEPSWPTLNYPAPQALTTTVSNIGTVSEDKLGIISISSRLLDTNFPPVGGDIRSLDWITPSIIAVGLAGVITESTGVKYMDVSSRSLRSDYAVIPGKANSFQTGGVVIVPTQNVTIDVPLGAATFQALNPVVDTIQLIAPTPGVFLLAGQDAEIVAPSITLFPATGVSTFATYDPLVTPVDFIAVVPLATVTFVANDPILTISSPNFVLMAASDPAYTARDATPVAVFNLGSSMYGAASTIGFRLANTTANFNIYTISAVGANTSLVAGARFSFDKTAWIPTSIVRVPPNGVSEVIYLQLTVPAAAPVGASTLLLQINVASSTL